MKNVLENDLQIAREVKNKLMDKFTIFDFRLFGSRARGVANWDSDMDLYIEVLDLNKDQRRLINNIAWEVGFAHDIVISPIVVTKNQLENSPFKLTPIYDVIQKEGVLI